MFPSKVMALNRNSDCFIKKEFTIREIIDTIVVSDSEDEFLPKTPRSKRKILGKQNKTSPKKLQPSQSILSTINPSSTGRRKVSKDLQCTDFFAIKKHVNVIIKEEENAESLSSIITQKHISESSNSFISQPDNLEIDSVFNDLPSNITEIDIVDHNIKSEISDSPPENLTQNSLFAEPKLKIKLDIPFNQSHMGLTQLKPSQATNQSKIPDYFQNSKSTKETSIILTQAEEATAKQLTRYSSESNNKLLQNALKISQWTLKNENLINLFTEPEIDLIANLFKFPNKKCTILCLRLFPRIDKWYKMDQLCDELNLKDDEFNLQDLFEQLSTDYLTSDYFNENTNTLLNLLPSGDIKDICVSYKIKCKRVKSVMINKLFEFTSTQTTLGMGKKSSEILREKIIKKFGLRVRLKSVFKDAFYRIHLLYSLANPDLEKISDLYNFINRYHVDLIKNSGISYCKDSRVFQQREDFLR